MIGAVRSKWLPGMSNLVTIHWFKKGLRLHDNAGLLHAVTTSKVRDFCWRIVIFTHVVCLIKVKIKFNWSSFVRWKLKLFFRLKMIWRLNFESLIKFRLTLRWQSFIACRRVESYREKQGVLNCSGFAMAVNRKDSPNLAANFFA